QDAVSAQDPQALRATREILDRIYGRLASSSSVLDAALVASLRGALGDYFDAAQDISRRLIAGETGEGLVDAMAAMQAKQSQAAEALIKATRLDRNQVTASFAGARHSREAANQI